MKVSDTGTAIYDVNELGEEWKTILGRVGRGERIGIEKKGKLVARVLPAKKKRLKLSEEEREARINEFIKKNEGSWAGQPWAENLGKSSRYFRKRNIKWW